MQGILLVIIIGVIGGVAVGIQSPLGSLIAQRMGPMESVFILHFGGAFASGVVLLANRGGALSQWQSLPWYTLIAGFLGLVVISAATYAIPRLGAGTSALLIVSGQMLISVVIDHFGLFGVMVRPIEPSRILGFVIVAVGIWLLVR